MFPVVIVTFMNGPVRAYKTIRIDIMCGTRNTIDTHDFDYWSPDLLIEIYGRGMCDEPVTVILHWLSREHFLCHVVAGDDFVSCWSCPHLIPVDWVALREDQLVSFNFGFNISICILFLHLVELFSLFPYLVWLLLSYPNGRSFVFQYFYSAHDQVFVGLVIELHAYWVDIFSVGQSLPCGTVC